MRARGDFKRGEQIYRRAEPGCVACYAVNGMGGSNGSNLSALGTVQPVEFTTREVLRNEGIRLRAAVIKEKKQNGSVMPAGLAETRTRAEFRDLIRYLSQFGKPAK